MIAFHQEGAEGHGLTQSPVDRSGLNHFIAAIEDATKARMDFDVIVLREYLWWFKIDQAINNCCSTPQICFYLQRNIGWNILMIVGLSSCKADVASKSQGNLLPSAHCEGCLWTKLLFQ